MTSWQRDRLVEARADAILADAGTAEAYAGHFEAQLRAARLRSWTRRAVSAVSRALRTPNMILLAVLAIALVLAFAAS